MSKNMKKFIAYLLVGALLGMILPLLPAQENQNIQQSDPEIEALKKRVSELEKQLQTVENVEKMDLQAKLAEANVKLAEANTKLINAEFGKFERGLKDSNDERMRNWVIFFVAIVSTAGVAFWFVVKSLIADRVEKNLKGFKAAVDQVEVMKDELRELEKKHVVSILETIIGYGLQEECYYPEPIKILQEETLLQILDDETCRPAIRYKAAEVLLARKSSQLVSPLLNLLNSLVNSDSDLGLVTSSPEDGVIFLRQIATLEAHQGLEGLLNRLLTEDLNRKDWFLRETVFSLAGVSVKLNLEGSISILKRAIPHLKDLEPADLDSLGDLARYFDVFNDPAGIKDILNYHVTGGMPWLEEARKRLEETCLELLQKHDSEYVKEWRAKRTTTSSNI